MVAPIPPPYGGIGHWTLMMRQYASTQLDVDLHVVDTAPRWRAVDDMAVWKRVLGGGVQLVRDTFRLLCQMKWHPDVIHLTTSGQLATFRDLAIIRIAHAFSVPVVYHIHFGRIPELAGGSSREWKLIAKAMRASDVVVAIDASTEDAIRNHLPEVKVVYIPNCVDVNRLPSPLFAQSEEKTAVFLGWVIPTKGIEELVQAWAELQPVGWKLLIVGPGSKDYHRQLLEKYRSAGIEFAGEKSHDEAMDFMASCDLFVLPSYTEGFPNVILEAMALGKPIIATRVGAIPEMLPEGYGLLIEPQSVSELKSALQRLMSDTDLRNRLGSQSHDRVLSEYSLDAVFSRLLGLWKSLVPETD